MDHAKPSTILFLSPFSHPEKISTGRYNTQLVEALGRVGHCVRVVASHPLYPDWKPERSTAALAGVEIHRGGPFMRYPRSNVPRRILLELWFALHALAVSQRWRKDIDTVVAIFPPDLCLLALQLLLPRTVCAGSASCTISKGSWRKPTGSSGFSVGR